MIELRRADRENRWDAELCTWWPALSDGRRTAVAACGAGHAYSLTGHKIAPDGTVTPSVVCPHEGCTWHEHVRLVGWRAA